MIEADFDKIAFRLSRVFTPTSPINKDDLFQGRKSQIRAVIDAINQAGKHAILYGERGVGKTSLGRILQTKLKSLESLPIIAPMVTCDSGDDFSTIWSKVFSELEEVAVSDDDSTPYSFTPHDVRRKLEPIAASRILYVILDEFDKIIDDRSRALIADTIKLFSDRSVNATLVIIGVSDDVNGLIADHQSIERCLAQIHMPRMPRKELEEIVTHGLQEEGLEMTVEPDGLAEITGLSKGLPCYTHLLALHASRHALDERRLKVTAKDVEKAIRTAISETQESIRDDYDKATYSSRKGTLYREVLLACAIAAADEFGRFQPGDVCAPLDEIVGKKPFTTDRFAGHLKAFCEDDRGNVLERMGTDYRWRYRFSNPLMQPFVIMKGIETGLISDATLKALIEKDERYPLYKKKPPSI